MPESICTGDCLDVDANGRIIIVPDNTTIVCESDGAGGTHLVAKTLDCDGWPLTCDPSTTASQVYCHTDNNLYVEKPYQEMGRQGFDNAFSDASALPGLLNGPIGTVIAEQGLDITNNDPCCREACVKVFFNWNKYAIPVGIGGAYEFNYEFSTNGGQTWSLYNDSFYRNTTNDVVLHSPNGTTNHTTQFTLACNETRNVRMRMVTGPFHDPTTDFFNTATPVSIYSFFIDWIAMTDTTCV